VHAINFKPLQTFNHQQKQSGNLFVPSHIVDEAVKLVLVERFCTEQFGTALCGVEHFLVGISDLRFLRFGFDSSRLASFGGRVLHLSVKFI